MRCPKYAWVGNQISDEDMYRLYLLKKETKKPITHLVAQAVKTFLKEKEGVIYDFRN